MVEVVFDEAFLIEGDRLPMCFQPFLKDKLDAAGVESDLVASEAAVGGRVT